MESEAVALAIVGSVVALSAATVTAETARDAESSAVVLLVREAVDSAEDSRARRVALPVATLSPSSEAVLAVEALAVAVVLLVSKLSLCCCAPRASQGGAAENVSALLFACGG
jgi:hypothetical protein